MAGWAAYQSASALVESARLADAMPALATHVPTPPVAVTMVYYAALAGMVVPGLKTAPTGTFRNVLRAIASSLLVVAAFLIVSAAWLTPALVSTELRLTMFDVGQGEAMHLVLPGEEEGLLIDTGGAPFGGGGFDIGDRVLRPALWAQRVTHIGGLLITHADPDHVGGALAVLRSFSPDVLFEGIPVAGHEPMSLVRDEGRRRGTSVQPLRVGDLIHRGGARVRVLSPPPPDWERPRVRNDDSVVLEVRYGNIAILLTGDISAEVERQILPQLSDAPIRVLKVGHHGSRTSTSAALVAAWRPQVALVSCGRGNRFGHPAPEVIARLDEAGARIYRTDRHGAITVTSDGRSLEVTTFVP
jgi:competence protein ComEC